MRTAAVPIPLMPKGVEHFTGTTVTIQVANVPIPLMPKGVEHQIVGMPSSPPVVFRFR